MQHQSSASCAPYALFRVKQGGTKEQVGEHPSFEEGWSAGTQAVHEDRNHAYALYQGHSRVAGFGSSRLQPRRQSFDWSVLG